ncbi:PxxKW family cysteine-rich protein [Maridesulfovibrio sp.]|uniref:PxxKW family cysteine-rich protein n=1 Tax=Maridesulfovibrio sp. TaxID=2795000 RepID=UPI002A18A8FC|nr:PxxKW family cysteine-rich protein [Maridesulfovibrio sp.]
MAKKNVKVHALEGAEMTAEGLSYKGVIMEPVVEKCDGCERTVEFDGQKYCHSYAQPAQKWAHSVCNFATHVRAGVDKEGKVKVNPLKASKRAARGR